MQAKVLVILVMLGAICYPRLAKAVSPTADEMREARRWAAAAFAVGSAAKPAFSFTDDGKFSGELLAACELKQDGRKLDDQRTERTLTWTDPKTGLEVRCASVEYADFPVVEWTVYLRNTGKDDTPILENIQAMNAQWERSDGGVFGAYAPSKDYTPPQDPAVLKKLSEWQDQKLGLLITWGTYSQWGIVESWTLCPERYEWNRRTGPFAGDDRAYKESYEQLINTFNPVKFDPAKWAVAAKDGGVKYVLLMAKHHDGFCMFDTATTDYRITSPRCPFHTDPRANVLKEMSAAFRKEGLSVGAYFSKADWNSPFYWSPDFPLRDRNVNYNTAKHPDLWNQFKDFTWRQIEELMTGYGPQDILWLDGGQVRAPEQDIDVTGMAAMARKHQPGLIVVDRTVRGENENYVTPEQEIPDHFLPYPWETCMTMGTAWPWKPNDQFKSAGTLIRHLCTIVARGGNLLLGIGPDANGEFDPIVYARLEEMGKWLKLNGEAVYETRPIAPYEENGCVFTQKRDGAVYAIVLPKDDSGVLPESVSFPVQLAAKGCSLTLLGFGPLEPGETKGGEAVAAIPPAARANPPCANAWAIKISHKQQ